MLALILDGVPLLILVACIGWFVKFSASQQKGDRRTLKWHEMAPTRKTLAAIIIVWIGLNLYLSIGNELALLNIVILPFSWIYSLARPAVEWGSAATFVSLAIFFQLRFPRRPVLA